MIPYNSRHPCLWTCYPPFCRAVIQLSTPFPTWNGWTNFAQLTKTPISIHHFQLPCFRIGGDFIHTDNSTAKSSTMGTEFYSPIPAITQLFSSNTIPNPRLQLQYQKPKSDSNQVSSLLFAFEGHLKRQTKLTTRYESCQRNLMHNVWSSAITFQLWGIIQRTKCTSTQHCSDQFCTRLPMPLESRLCSDQSILPLWPINVLPLRLELEIESRPLDLELLSRSPPKSQTPNSTSRNISLSLAYLTVERATIWIPPLEMEVNVGIEVLAALSWYTCTKRSDSSPRKMVGQG